MIYDLIILTKFYSDSMMINTKKQIKNYNNIVLNKNNRFDLTR
jgi:hypothetical protein